MSLFSTLKRNARAALKNNWGRAIVACLIPMAAVVVLSILENVTVQLFVPSTAFNPGFAMRYGFSEYFFQKMAGTTPVETGVLLGYTLLSVLLLSPLNLGLVRWFFQLVGGRSAPLGELFYFYESMSRYKRAVWYHISIGVRTFLWAFLFYLIPGGVFGASIYMLAGSGLEDRAMAAMGSMGLLLSAVLFVLCTLFYFAVISRYALMPYLLGEDETRSVKDALRLSVAYTKGHRFALVWFPLSFLGWILLCVFVFPWLYVLPYRNTSNAMYARYLIEKNRTTPQGETQEFVMDDTTPSSLAQDLDSWKPPTSGWPDLSPQEQESSPFDRPWDAPEDSSAPDSWSGSPEQSPPIWPDLPAQAPEDFSSSEPWGEPQEKSAPAWPNLPPTETVAPDFGFPPQSPEQDTPPADDFPEGTVPPEPPSWPPSL